MVEKWLLSSSAVKKSVAGGVFGLTVLIERRVLHRCLGVFAVDSFWAMYLLFAESRALDIRDLNPLKFS